MIKIACPEIKGKNLFFHGTFRDNYSLIKNNGFKIERERATFSLDPIWSLGYCGKSESYLHSMINKKQFAELNIEIRKLLDVKAITKADLKDEVTWIRKASNYYDKTENRVNSGVFLIFKLPWRDIAPPKESEMKLKGNELAGVPSYWRTRQYAYFGTKNILKKELIATIFLTARFVKLMENVAELFKRGNLNKKEYLKFKKELLIEIKNMKIDSKLSPTFLAKYLAERSIEGRVIRWVRTLYVAKLIEKGTKVDEPERWRMNPLDINKNLETISKNYLSKKLRDYFNQNSNF